MQDFEYLLENEIGVIVLISAGVSFLTLIIAIMLAVRLSSMPEALSYAAQIEGV